MDEINIDKGIALPAHKYKWADVFRRMEVGDSFVAPRTSQSACLLVARRNRMKIATRKISATQLRVWRIA